MGRLIFEVGAGRDSWSLVVGGGCLIQLGIESGILVMIDDL
jgi:hypothetical protein